MSEPLLRFRIAKRYSGFSLDCEAEFESGVAAVFGPSGSGKTTLLNCIAGIVRPDEGEITMMGEPVYSSQTRVNLAPEKRRCGYVFQDSALFPHMDVWGNIMYGHNLTPRDRREADPEQLVDLFQLSALKNRRVINLSGGERQRVALARALATSPRLVLLDEPLASLDVAFKGVILRYLKRIWTELGTPMLYVSHSVSEVMTLATEMLVLSGGKEIAQGRPSHVLVHPNVASLADYRDLENLVEARVISKSSEEEMGVLSVGEVELKAPEVHAEPGQAVTVSVRAGDIILALEVPTKISAQNILRATVDEVHTRGARVLVYVDVGTILMVEITATALRDLDLTKGQDVYLILKSASILVLDTPGGGYVT